MVLAPPRARLFGLLQQKRGHRDLGDCERADHRRHDDLRPVLDGEGQRLELPGLHLQDGSVRGD